MQELGNKPVIYQFDDFPHAFRVQVYYLIQDVFRSWEKISYQVTSDDLWSYLESAIKQERGLLQLAHGYLDNSKNVRDYLIESVDMDEIIDVLEFVMNTTEVAFSGGGLDLEKFVTLLNRRFKDHNLGYEYVSNVNPGQIMRVDSQLLHVEVVESSIALMHDDGFTGPLEEFAEAHKKYREGDNKGAIHDACKAFESTMKSIASVMGWSCEPTAPASKLVNVMQDNGIFPPSMQDFNASLVKLLNNSVPTLRNKNSGHGQGHTVVEIPDSVVAYALHLTGSNIVFLITRYHELQDGKSEPAS